MSYYNSSHIRMFQVYMFHPITLKVMNMSYVMYSHFDLNNYLLDMSFLKGKYRFSVYFSNYILKDNNYSCVNYGNYEHHFPTIVPETSHTNTNSNTHTVNSGHDFNFDPPVPPTNQNEINELVTNVEEILNMVESSEIPPPVDENEWNYIDTPRPRYEGMKMKKFGRGYQLKCEDTHPDYGIKYYPTEENCKAWWQPCHQVWFLRRENKDYFLDNGAEFVYEW